jgi:hypothetical protein
MSYEVDVGGLGPITVGEGEANQVTVGLVWPSEIASFQWPRLSPSIHCDAEQNPPGTRLRIVGERYGIQGDGQQFTEFTILNDRNPSGPFPAATFTLSLMVMPRHPSDCVMRVQVLFDEAGKVKATYHLRAENNAKKYPVASLRPQEGEHVATVEIPKELEHLKPNALHASVRVDRSGATPRLVAKTQ